MSLEHTVIITGASGGLGLATACALASRRVPVLLACRNLDRGERARASVIAASEGLSPDQVAVFSFMLKDLASEGRGYWELVAVAGGTRVRWTYVFTSRACATR